MDEAISKVLDEGQYILGNEIFELEEQLKNYVGVSHACVTSSGTDALLISLMALGIGLGDEVITTSFTWISTVEVIKRVGAKPVLVDIDPHTLVLDLDQVEKAISSKTKAIIPVSLYGQIADMDRLDQISKEFGITIIEDGAQSFGSSQRGKKSGSLSKIGCTSFFPAKPLGCYGDGGAVFTSDDELAEKIKAIRIHGAITRGCHTYVGINGRMDTIQAAVLLVKLKHFDEELLLRQQVAQNYYDRLREDFKLQTVLPYNTSVYAQFIIRVADRDNCLKELQNKGIPTAIHYKTCVFEHPAYADLKVNTDNFQHALKASHEVLGLPMHPFLKKEEQDYICEMVKESALAPLL